METQVQKKFYTVAEFARLTGDSESTIRREIRAGNLPFRQSGPRKKIKIPIEALDIRSEPNSSNPDERICEDQQVQETSERFSGPNPDWLD